ncbi:hypothetical protein [Streptomyces sp. NPDC001833]|uniref:hypothetical protein n=1 Tax=Streptomyces sp. NPDC001833 TaxID=3154658 RepID=UPI0033224CF8
MRGFAGASRYYIAGDFFSHQSRRRLSEMEVVDGCHPTQPLSGRTWQGAKDRSFHMELMVRFQPYVLYDWVAAGRCFGATMENSPVV